MAVWQFQATLVPFATAVDHGLLPGHRLSHAQREEIAWWSGKTVAVEKLQQLSKVLPAGKSWTEELEVFGDLETTCVTIFSDRGAVVEGKCSPRFENSIGRSRQSSAGFCART